MKRDMAKPEWDDHRLDLTRREQVQLAIAIPAVTVLIWVVLILLFALGPQ